MRLIYACGVRLREGVQLQVTPIDRARMQLRMQGGTGNTDRAIPLPERTLPLLRAHWRTHRTPVWRFPSPGPAHDQQATATTPMHERGVPNAVRHAVQAAGLTNHAAVPTLRHAWATHRRESGVNVRVIPVWMGHSSLTTTAIATHCTRTAEQLATDALNQRTAGMP